MTTPSPPTNVTRRDRALAVGSISALGLALAFALIARLIEAPWTSTSAGVFAAFSLLPFAKDWHRFGFPLLETAALFAALCGLVALALPEWPLTLCCALLSLWLGFASLGEAGPSNALFLVGLTIAVVGSGFDRKAAISAAVALGAFIASQLRWRHR